jgi:hypothetical protein
MLLVQVSVLNWTLLINEYNTQIIGWSGASEAKRAKRSTYYILVRFRNSVVVVVVVVVVVL